MLDERFLLNYSSMYGEPIPAGMIPAPVVISDAEYAANNRIVPENLRIWDKYGINVRIGFIPVAPEDLDRHMRSYNLAINGILSEHAKLRPGRCLLGHDESGYPKLCSKENRCSDCPHRNENLPRFRNLEDYLEFISIQHISEDEDGSPHSVFLVDESSLPVDTIVENRIMLEELLAHWNKVNPTYAIILTMYRNDCPLKEIIEAIGMSDDPNRGYREIQKAFKKSRKYLIKHNWI